MQEKRQIKRTPASLFVRFAVDEHDEKKFESWTQDISADGVRLLSETPLPMNETLDMNIDIPTNPDITWVMGNVRWVEQKPVRNQSGQDVYPIGIAFTYIDRQDKLYLEEYLRDSAS